MLGRGKRGISACGQWNLITMWKVGCVCCCSALQVLASAIMQCHDLVCAWWAGGRQNRCSLSRHWPPNGVTDLLQGHRRLKALPATGNLYLHFTENVNEVWLSSILTIIMVAEAEIMIWQPHNILLLFMYEQNTGIHHHCLFVLVACTVYWIIGQINISSSPVNIRCWIWTYDGCFQFLASHCLYSLFLL